MRVAAVGTRASDGQAIVLLEAVDSGVFVPVPVGWTELTASVQVLEQIDAPRPTTHDLLAQFLVAAQIDLVGIRLEYWQDGIMAATIAGDANGRTIEVDARPSDAIAVALRLGTTIYSSPGVLRRFSVQETDQIENDFDLRELPANAFGNWVM